MNIPNTTHQKNYGPVLNDHCAACNQETVWVLVSLSEKFNLFGTHLFNYKQEYALLCSNCKYGVGLEKTLFEKLKTYIKKNNPA